MTLMQIDLNEIPYSLISAAIAFISSYAVVRYQIDNLKTIITNLKKTVSDNHEKTEIKFQLVEDKREQLKDMVHDIDKKVSEIHAIITKTR